MNHYRIEIAYDGTGYVGWQVQPNGTSIQEVVQSAVATLVGHPAHVTGSGRTDSGVHALAQTAHFASESPLDLKKALRSLNALLPCDIRISLIAPAPAHFHPRYSAKSKVYRYHLCLKPVQPPFRRLYALHYSYPIERELLEAAAGRLIGERDFTSFANASEEGCAGRDAVRTLQRVDFYDREGELVVEFEADGFLYKMVRNLMGAILSVGRGKTPPDQLTEILEGRDRRLAPEGVAAHGLFLTEVKYPREALEL